VSVRRWKGRIKEAGWNRLVSDLDGFVIDGFSSLRLKPYRDEGLPFFLIRVELNRPPVLLYDFLGQFENQVDRLVPKGREVPNDRRLRRLLVVAEAHGYPDEPALMGGVFLVSIPAIPTVPTIPPISSIPSVSILGIKILDQNPYVTIEGSRVGGVLK